MSSPSRSPGRTRTGTCSGRGLPGRGNAADGINHLRQTDRRGPPLLRPRPVCTCRLVLGRGSFPTVRRRPSLPPGWISPPALSAGKVRVILVSGDNTAPEYNEPEAMRTYLIDAGIPDGGGRRQCGLRHVQLMRPGTRIFGVRPDRRHQSYHLPRAVATCLRVGVNAYGVGDEVLRQYTRSWRSGASAISWPA